MKIMNKKVSFKGAFLEVITKEMTIGGEIYTWECVKRESGVYVFPLTSKKEIILEKTYRFPLEKYEISLPAGTIDKAKESPMLCAKRELREETGYEAKKMISVFKFPLDSGVLESMGELFFAPDVEHKGGEKRDKLELMEIIKIPLKKLPEFLFNPPKGCMVDIRIFGALEIIKEKKLI
jgi:ADP-ribose pyrophosphatase